ncbi:hypothetical protein OUZ56_013074 [Daphnia magna]|uniref:Uncharacterized protein n=1 Tax=Daphnia magna TaxID=35525 RepID=A0ABQ9Z4T4_9CRUS|nr:hypothetical protein OUZ56_013074 [Daphnia magna]
MPKRTNPRLPSCPRDPSRRLHPLRELSSVPDHLTEEADSRGESVETARGLDSDPETEIDLRAATSPVVPAVGQQFVVPSRHIEQPQRQAMEGVRKFISSLIFRKSSEEVAHQLMERFEEYSTHNRWDESPSGELPELGSVGVVPWSLQTLSEFGMVIPYCY